MNNFKHAYDGFDTNDDYYTDTDSLKIENKPWDKLDKTRLVVKSRLQGRNVYKEGVTWYDLILAPKIKYCLTINKFGIIDEHLTFQIFTNLSDNLDKKEYFNMANGGKITIKVPLSWKKSFSMGVVIRQKIKYCTNCRKVFYVINVINW